MTINQIALRLFTHFSPEEREIPDHPDYQGRNADILNAINGAIEEMYEQSPSWIAKDQRGVVIKSPVTLQLAVTEDSADAIISEADWKDWMSGCAIVISDQPNQNRILNATRQIKMRFPYDGQSGTISATVYHDSIELDPDVLRVIEPLIINGVTLVAVNNSSSIGHSSSEKDFGFHLKTSHFQHSFSSTASSPVAYSIESWRPTSNSAPISRIHLFPTPSAKSMLQYECMMAPPFITDLNSQDGLPIPHHFVSSIFLPIAEKRLSASPFYRGVRSAESIAENYRMAMEMLAKSNPRKNQGIRFSTIY